MALVIMIDTACAEHRFDRQLALVGEHWAAGRRLWLSDSDLDPGAKIRSELPPDFEIGYGLPGLADIKPARDGRFEFSEDGRPAIIIPAYDCIAGMLDANAERHVEELRDLVAVDLERPDHFLRRHGEAVVLGAAYLEIASQEGEPVPIFRNPLSWLRSGGAGVCILDWRWARDLLLDHELVAETVALGERLEAALKPGIWVAETAA